MVSCPQAESQGLRSGKGTDAGAGTEDSDGEGLDLMARSEVGDEEGLATSDEDDAY